MGFNFTAVFRESLGIKTFDPIALIMRIAQVRQVPRLKGMKLN